VAEGHRRLRPPTEPLFAEPSPSKLSSPAPEPNSNGRPDLRLPSKIPLNAILDAAVCLSYIHRAPRRLCLWLSFSLYTHLAQQSSSSQQLAIKSTTTISTDSDISIHLRLQSLPTTSIITPDFAQPFNITNRPTNINTYIMSACQQPLARPQPQPQQNVMNINSDGSISSTPTSTSGRGSMHNIFSSPEIARCSRCHRTPSIDIATGKSNMVQYGLNQYYCSRCAGMVGYYSR
jgi:hypothetical protein